MRQHLLLLLALLLLLSSCASRYAPYAQPPPRLMDLPATDSIRIAVVLGGGGSRGMAHLGVLEELELAGLRPDYVVGCSAGSLVGALYCAQPKADLVHSLLCDLKRPDLLDWKLHSGRYGLASGRRLCRFVRRHLPVHTFEELSIPLVCVATDLVTGEQVTIGQGPIAPAVQASCAFPLVFEPVELHGRCLVDGGVVQPLPVEIARALDPQIVIAVDVAYPLPDSLPTNLFGVAKRSIEITYAARTTLSGKEADVLIRPDLGDVGIFDDNNHQLAYEAGREAARQALPKIAALLQQNPTL